MHTVWAKNSVLYLSTGTTTTINNIVDTVNTFVNKHPTTPTGNTTPVWNLMSASDCAYISDQGGTQHQQSAIAQQPQ